MLLKKFFMHKKKVVFFEYLIFEIAHLITYLFVLILIGKKRIELYYINKNIVTYKKYGYY